MLFSNIVAKITKDFALSTVSLELSRNAVHAYSESFDCKCESLIVTSDPTVGPADESKLEMITLRTGCSRLHKHHIHLSRKGQSFCLLPFVKSVFLHLNSEDERFRPCQRDGFADQ